MTRGRENQKREVAEVRAGGKRDCQLVEGILIGQRDPNEIPTILPVSRRYLTYRDCQL